MVPERVVSRKITIRRCIVQMSHLGNTSVSSNTTSMDSRASTEAAYEPPGPAPTTKTVNSAGIDMLIMEGY